MKIKFYLLVFIILLNNNLFSQINISIKSKVFNNNQNIEISWTSPLAILYNVYLMDNFNNKYSIAENYYENSIEFKVDDINFLNKYLTLYVENAQNQNENTKIENILIYEELKIRKQTKSSVICVGSPHIISIEVDGYGQKYQWYKDDIPISNANYSFIEFPEIVYENSGVYYCIITDEFRNEVVSESIVVFVSSETKFIETPKIQLFSYGQTAKFETKIHLLTNKEKPFDIQWYKETIYKVDKYLFDTTITKLVDNNRIQGAKSEILQISKMYESDMGRYYCIVSGACGRDSVSTFLEDSLFFIIKDPKPIYVVCEGSDVELKVEIEQLSPGIIEYQWFNAYKRRIVNNDKFQGANTNTLLIKNNSTDDSMRSYFCVLYYLPEDISLRTNIYFVFTEEKPKINFQSYDYAIDPNIEGQTYARVDMKNLQHCVFNWYKNDKLILRDSVRRFSRFPKPPIATVPPTPLVFHKPTKSDVGTYYCEIINDCGTVQTEKINVFWGKSPYTTCINESIYLEIDNLDTQDEQFTYRWELNNITIQDNDNYQYSNTNKLLVKNTNLSNIGYYHIYATSNKTNIEKKVNILRLEIYNNPQIIYQFPDTIYLDGQYLKRHYLMGTTNLDKVQYQVYDINGKSYGNIKTAETGGPTYPYFEIGVGGKFSDLPDGIYYMKIWHKCGTANSENFVVTHTNAIIGQIQNFSSVNYENNKFEINPNPANEFININLKNIRENQKEIFIYNMFGEIMKSVSIHSTQSQVKIKIDELMSGVYFVRIGNGIMKFVKY